MSGSCLYERFIRPMEARLIAAAWRVLRDEDQARDALQDALTRIWQHRTRLERHPNPQAWMLRITLNAACDQLRQRTRRRQQELTPDLTAALCPPDAALQERELIQRLHQEIARLSPQQRQAVLLRLIEGLSYTEVAVALGCTEQTARVHVERGRKRLGRRLTDLHPALGSDLR
jgi:RNA polymerase sigma-70 factor (ECF subfamily)